MKVPGPLIIEKFYDAFARKDYAEMQTFYRDDSTFSDPVFTHLASAEVKAMWQMLLTAGRDLSVTYRDVQQDGSIQRCEWHAHYTFSRTGKRVHNIIRTEMEIREGKIFRHQDDFDFWRWSRQALGITGLLMGWTPGLKAKVRQTANQSLRSFMAKNSSH